MRAQDLPSHDDIPPVPGMPHGCAWGLWDKNGEKDQLGALNLLTSEVVQEAGKEIQTGDRCVLKFFSYFQILLISLQLGTSISHWGSRRSGSLPNDSQY